MIEQRIPFSEVKKIVYLTHQGNSLPIKVSETETISMKEYKAATAIFAKNQ